LAQICAGHQVAMVHGNGPQVGLLALEAAAYKDVPPYPFDVLGAESQGLLGYVISQAMRGTMPGREIAAVVTQTLVDPADSAFKHPTKPIGPVYSQADIADMNAPIDWKFAQEGSGMRRVVASPKPLAILELPSIKRLVAADVLTICCGGGGIPVINGDKAGALKGVEAVIDKDLGAALLAIELGADQLVILTDVDGIYADFGFPAQRLIRSTSVTELKTMTFPPGSMGPKVEAACRFLTETGNPVRIGNLQAASAVMSGEAGTMITDRTPVAAGI